MNRVICVWLPEWPIQRFVVARPELKSAPLVLHAPDSRRGQRVVACCALARQQGVSLGMPLAEVTALRQRAAVHSRFDDEQSGPRGARQSTSSQPSAKEKAKREGKAPKAASRPAIQLQEHQAVKDNEALLELAVWCEQFSPIVGVEASDSPACLLLDVTGLGRLFGDEHRLVELMLEAFQQRGYQVRVGLADTVGAAWALAHYGSPAHSYAEAAPGQMSAALEPLPVEALRLPEEIVLTLRRLGVFTIEQLLQLPRSGLATRWGKALIQRMDQALGVQSEVIIAHRPPPEFAAEWRLEHPTDRRNVLETILSRLGEQVAATLAENDHAAVQVEAWLVGSTESRCLQVGLFQPSNNPQHIDDLLRLQLETTHMRQPVQCVRLAAVTTIRTTGQQHLLWEDAGQNTPRELALLVDRLSSRLGKENVFGVQAQAGALPERAYREKSLSDVMKSQRRAQAQRSAFLPAHRPLWLQEPPLPLVMVSVAATGTAEEGPPIFFQYQNTRHDVAKHWGPERIETGWWKGRCVRRDYYRVETTTGYRFWLFRRLSDGAWFLHGCFE